MSRAIGYARGSSEQAPDHEVHDELDAQDAAIACAARDGGLELVRTYTDASTHDDGPLERRPGLLNAIGVLARGDTLIVATRERLGPSPVQTAMIERLVASKGCRLVAGEDSDEPCDAGRRDAAITRSMIGTLGEYERFVMACRTRTTFPGRRVATRQDTGRHADPSRGQVQDGVRSIIQAHLLAGWQPNDIAAELNRRGLSTASGAAWNGVNVLEVGDLSDASRPTARPTPAAWFGVNPVPTPPQPPTARASATA